jgi:hypothetical protein
MVEWNPPPKVALQNALHDAWQELQTEVEGDPPFEKVTGIQPEILTAQAVQAVAAYDKTTDSAYDRTSALVQLFCMGFVVGTKYGEQRRSAPD